MKKYAIFDHTTGSYTFYSMSQEDVTRVLAQKILEVHMKLTNNNLWLMVEDVQDEQGNVGHRYTDPQGNELPDTFLLQYEMEKVIFQMINPTPPA